MRRKMESRRRSSALERGCESGLGRRSTESSSDGILGAANSSSVHDVGESALNDRIRFIVVRVVWKVDNSSQV